MAMRGTKNEGMKRAKKAGAVAQTLTITTAKAAKKPTLKFKADDKKTTKR